jgi:hypothetical protein
MDGDQGAINKLLTGNVSGALHDIETSLGNLFSDDLVPALKTFVSQFATPFGSQVLAAAETEAASVISGSTTMEAAGTALVSQVGTDALQDGENAATVALNALRVQITAASPNASSGASASPQTGS